MRIWAVGDIHGELRMLKKLLEKLFREENLNLKKDILVFTGDYVDRGKYSYEVLRILKNLQTKYPKNVIVLKGNHEDMMIKALTRNNYDDMYLWKINGGKQTIKSCYRIFKSSTPPVEWLCWLNSMPIIFKYKKFVFSHAPITALHEYNNPQLFYHQLIWKHIPNISAEPHITGWAYNNKIVGVCGHIHRLQNNINSPRLYPHYIFNDSGCGCHETGRLSAIEVKSRTIVIVGKEDFK